MAVLSIEDLPDELYERLEKQAQRNGRTLADEVIHLLEAGIHPRALHSILELQGLGKEVWAGVDAAAYIEEERASWDD